MSTRPPDLLGGRFWLVLSVLIALMLTSWGAAATAGLAPPTVDDDKLVTFGIGPSGAVTSDRRPYLSYGLAPGASVTDHVAVYNQSNAPVDLIVYAGDGVNGEAGGLDILKRDERNHDLGAWVNLGADAKAARPALSGRSTVKVRVPAQTRTRGIGLVIVPVRITVPTDATPGDHVGGIAAALISRGKSPTAQNLELEQRVAARVYVQVAGELKPKLSVKVLRTDYLGGGGLGLSGKVRVAYRVTNVGNTRLGATTRVKIRGPFGLGNRTTDGPRADELVPGGSATFTATVDEVPPTILAWADVTVEALTAPGAKQLKVAPATASARLWAVTWQELVLLLLLLLLVWAVLFRRRRRGAILAKGKHVRPLAAGTRARPPALLQRTRVQRTR